MVALLIAVIGFLVGTAVAGWPVGAVVGLGTLAAAAILIARSRVDAHTPRG